MVMTLTIRGVLVGYDVTCLPVGICLMFSHDQVGVMGLAEGFLGGSVAKNPPAKREM